MTTKHKPLNLLCIGGTSGLGKEISYSLIKQGHDVMSAGLPEIDITTHIGVYRLREVAIRAYGEAIDGIINSVGVNRVMNFKDVEASDLFDTLNANVVSHAMVAKAFLPLLSKSKGFHCSIGSNAWHLPMSCSLAYNMSKAAQWMFIRHMAHDAGKRAGVTFFGVAPNKLAGTPMSQSVEQQIMYVRGMTREELTEKQLAQLPCGEETPPEAVAEFIASIISRPNDIKYLQGCILPFGGPCRI